MDCSNQKFSWYGFFVLSGALAVVSGCSSTAARISSREAYLYPGVRWDADAMTDGGTPKSSFIIFGALDTVPSAVMDTVFLPYDLIGVATERHDVKTLKLADCTSNSLTFLMTLKYARVYEFIFSAPQSATNQIKFRGELAIRQGTNAVAQTQ